MAKKRKAKGIALTIGLNLVDVEHYDNWDGYLVAGEADAEDMADIARGRGFGVSTLLTKDATRDAVTAAISEAADDLVAGDIFFLSYSGHGSQVPDLNGDEDDALDETWCLYDGELVDDELNYCLAKFAEGVRVFVISDSCHSGTMVRALFTGAARDHDDGPKIKAMPLEDSVRVYRKNQEFYDGILTDPKYKDAEDCVKASVILISGCQDGQKSKDGATNSRFTEQLLIVWNNGKFKGNYRTFHKNIKKLMPSIQIPNYYLTGKKDTTFERMKALRI